MTAHSFTTRIMRRPHAMLPGQQPDTGIPTAWLPGPPGAGRPHLEVVCTSASHVPSLQTSPLPKQPADTSILLLDRHFSFY